MIGIYKYTNKINGKVYIGQSLNLEERHKNHIRTSRSKGSNGYNYLIHKAFRKYGIDCFDYEIIEECKKEKLNEREMYWIKHYRSYVKENGYNMTIGGDNTSYHHQRPIYQIDIETKRIINRFSSCFEAGRFIGESQANIRHCCNGKYKYAYGYLWVYVDKYDKNEVNSRNVCIKTLHYSGKSKMVNQCDKNTKAIIHTFFNSTEASTITGIGRSAIANCLAKLSNSAGGYYWEYAKL